MSSFRGRFTLGAITGSFFTSGAGDTAFRELVNPSDNSGSVTYNLIGNCIYLDGSLTPISISNLPVGFVLSGLQNLSTPCTIIGGGNNISQAFSSSGATALASLVWSSYSKSIVSTPINTSILLLATDINFVSIIDLFIFLKITASIAPTGFTDELDIVDTIDVNGDYSIVSTKWVVSNLTNPNTNSPMVFSPGDIGQITSSDGSYDFSTLTKINISSTIIVSQPFITQTPTVITFQIPPTVPPGTYTPTTQGTGFSGDAYLGPMSIIVADSSGIYAIAPGKTNDTLYMGSGSGNNITNDNAIPTPFIKTGYIGG